MCNDLSVKLENEQCFLRTRRENMRLFFSDSENIIFLVPFLKFDEACNDFDEIKLV
jgi:hypothetical protein